MTDVLVKIIRGVYICKKKQEYSKGISRSGYEYNE